MESPDRRTILPDAEADGRPGATIRPDNEVFPLLLLPAGRLAGAYTLERTIGVGGTAIVRLARQHALDRDVAVKAPLAGGVSLDAAMRVVQEAWVTGALEHPGVVPVHDVALDEADCPHIVMRRVEGWTWTELLADSEAVRERFGARDVRTWHLNVWMAVAGTVEHAHGRGVLHRDLKPDNVMIGPGGEAYVLDWGLAAALDDRAARYLPRAAELSGLAGTPRYMAPEMARGDGEAFGVATDVYLLGGLLYAILTGDGPHDGDDVHAVLAGIPHFVPRYPPGTPPRLAAIATAALSADPADRPSSAEALRRAVLAWMEDNAADGLVAAAEVERAALAAARAAGADGETIARHYAACRLGYEHALAIAPGAVGARSGLAAAREELVRWELARGEGRAAQRVLAEMEAPPPELVRAVTDALATAEAAEARARALVAEHDLSIGVRTRAFVTLVLGVLFTVAPLVAASRPSELTLDELVYGNLAMFGVIAGFWYWARDSLGRTALNRAYIRTIAAAPLLHVVVALAAEPLAIAPERVVVLMPVVPAALCLAVGAALAPWLALGGVGYSLAVLVSAYNPELRWYAHSAGHALVFAVALARWGPDALRALRAKRAALRT